MKVLNKDMTRESIKLFVTNNHQIYAEVFVKHHGKWLTETYFQSYDWSIDEEYINGTIKYIIKTWGLKDPKVVVVVK